MWYQFFYISSLVVILHNLTKEKQSSTNITEKHDACIEKPRHNRPPVYLETHAKDTHCKFKWQLSVGYDCQQLNSNSKMYDSNIFSPLNDETDNVNLKLVIILNLRLDQTRWWQNREAFSYNDIKAGVDKLWKWVYIDARKASMSSASMWCCELELLRTTQKLGNKLYNLTFEWDAIIIIHWNHWWSIWWNTWPCCKVRWFSWRIIDSFLRNKYKNNLAEHLVTEETCTIQIRRTKILQQDIHM